MHFAQCTYTLYIHYIVFCTISGTGIPSRLKSFGVWFNAGEHCACAHTHICTHTLFPALRQASTLWSLTHCVITSPLSFNSCAWQPVTKLNVCQTHTQMHTHNHTNTIPVGMPDTKHAYVTVIFVLTQQLLSPHAKRHQWHAEQGHRKRWQRWR